MNFRNDLAQPMSGFPAHQRVWAGVAAAAFAIGFQALALAQSPTPSAPAAAPTNAPIKQVSPGVFEIGKVRLDKRQRTVSFPAVLNMNQALIEYLVVTSSGKMHESLLRTDVEPYQIHLAMLLLGAKGAGTNAFPESNTLPLPGDRVAIELSWKADGKEKRCRAEELVYNRQTKSAMVKGDWVYNGSRTVEGTFVVQQIGSIVSVIVDPDALINNPRPGREDDEIWEIKGTGLPPLETPVQVTIKLKG